MDQPLLLPAPRRAVLSAGTARLEAGRLILLDSPTASGLLFIARRLQAALERAAGFHWDIVASVASAASTSAGLVGVTLRQAPAPELAGHGDQGYVLRVWPDTITVQSPAGAGLFYGVCTLVQILDQYPDGCLPCLEIVDWPAFPARAVMLDVSRNKVPRLETIYTLVDMLAGWKVNQLQLYTEHTFAYRDHRDVWAAASPVTGEEILALDAYCRERYVELVPNQNSFGHMERWLRQPRYLPLAELCGDIDTPWGTFRGPFSLCPLDPGSLDLLRGLYDELLPHFSSRMLNVGCDETWDLGQGRSREACLAAGGAAPVYLDFLLKLQAEVEQRGHLMQFWGDIVVHHPDLLSPALRSSIALEWGYEADHPFASHAAQFADKGVPFYVCPGTSSWCSIAGRTDNALANLRSAAAGGLEYGAIGYLITDWGDCGHWQALLVSYLGFAAGAAYAWDLPANLDLDMARAISLHAFRDPTGAAGRVAYDLGNIYQAVGYQPNNGSALFHVLQDPIEKLCQRPGLARVTADDFDCTREAIEEAVRPLAGARMDRPDAGLVTLELSNTAHLLQHACRRGLLLREGDTPRAGRWRQELAQDLAGLLPQYITAWTARNRPGGLPDSLARFERARADYTLA